MKNKLMQKISVLFLFLVMTVSLFGCATHTNTTPTKPAETGTQTETKKTEVTPKENVTDKKIINDFQGVADYIHKNKKLPDNYITKAEATKLGWKPGENLGKIAPGKSIGGDTFMNAEKSLPEAPKRTWKECDINYKEGPRGADRILYSSDGLVYSTSDHYKTFKHLYEGN